MLTIDSKDLQYLSGQQFSSIYQMPMKGHSDNLSRIDLLKMLVKGKRVVHFGCVDHLPLIEQRRRSGMWLHEILSGICTELVGVDINEEGVKYMNDEGFETHVSNVITMPVPESVVSRKWDYIVAGEVLEHIDNPVDFLGAIRAKYKDCTERIIITVPNAFSYTNFRFALKNIEMINTDHRFWFTPFTLMKVVMQAGITVEGFDLCFDEPPSVLSIKYWLKDRPLLRNRVVLVGKL
jgi:Methyltransferase domain